MKEIAQVATRGALYVRGRKAGRQPGRRQAGRQAGKKKNTRTIQVRSIFPFRGFVRVNARLNERVR